MERNIALERIRRIKQTFPKDVWVLIIQTLASDSNLTIQTMGRLSQATGGALDDILLPLWRIVFMNEFPGYDLTPENLDNLTERVRPETRWKRLVEYYIRSKPIRRIETGHDYVVLSQYGKYYAYQDDANIHIYTVDTGERIGGFNFDEYAYPMCFDSTERYLYANSGSGHVSCYDCETQRVIYNKILERERYDFVYLFTDTKHLVLEITILSKLVVIDTINDQVIREMTFPRNSKRFVHPELPLMFSFYQGYVSIYDLATLNKIREHWMYGNISRVFVGYTKLIIECSNNFTRVYNIGTFEYIEWPDRTFNAKFTISYDEQYFYTGSFIATLETPTVPVVPLPYARNPRFTKDGRFFIYTNSSGGISIIRLPKTPKLVSSRCCQKSPQYVNSCCPIQFEFCSEKCGEEHWKMHRKDCRAMIYSKITVPLSEHPK
jgi:hypothetical protein